MISKPAWRVSELSQEAFNASRPFSFKSHQQVVFVNTGDVLAGKFLHANISEAKGLPGQAKKALRRDDILLTEIRPGNGRFAYVNFNPEKYVVSTKFLVIESYGRVIPRFLYHVLTNQSALDEFQRIAESRSGTFPQITFESIAHFPVPVPPQQIQEELTRFFDSIENRITLLRETNITLESIAQALFKSWFVDFDPVNSKQAGREPEGMDAATAALFLAEFEESALGLIPRGWTVKRLGELVELVYGKALKATDRKDGAVPVYGSGGITGFHDEALVPHGSVIVGRKGTVGSLYWEERPFFPIDTTFYVRPTAAPLTFCYYAMQRLGLESMNTDAAVPGLNRENAYRLEFVVPTDAVLDSFDNIAAAIRNSIHANSRRARFAAATSHLRQAPPARSPRTTGGCPRMKPTLARLERLSLRAAWKHEAGEFTPWLAQDENLQLLAEALGLAELELVATEHPVGDFKVDILCTDDDGEIIIENQLEKTNHTHLGQIITYAAGVGAKKVVWVAESFRAEHVAALEFLNQNTTGDLNFFAVEVELWRIADSPMAPSFNVVVKPNDWSKAGRESARVAATATPTKQRQLQFWTALVEYLDAHKVPVKPQKPSPQHWLNSNPLGRSGFHVISTVHSREQRIGAEVYISHQQSKELFQKLLAQRPEIEKELGFELDWMELPDSHASRIAVFRADSDLGNEAAWPIYFGWLADKLSRLSAVFRTRVREL